MVSRPRATIGAKGRGRGSDLIAADSDVSVPRPGTASDLGSGNAIGIVSVNGMAGKFWFYHV